MGWNELTRMVFSRVNSSARMRRTHMLPTQILVLLAKPRLVKVTSSVTNALTRQVTVSRYQCSRNAVRIQLIVKDSLHHLW